MSTISESFESKRDFYCERGASIEEIESAEKNLNLVFADDYKEYLRRYGSVSCAGHELTGISEDENLDVVKATILNHKRNHIIPETYYTVEDTHIDGIVIWQIESGEIFQADYNMEPVKIHNSLAEYISTFV